MNTGILNLGLRHDGLVDDLFLVSTDPKVAVQHVGLDDWPGGYDSQRRIQLIRGYY